MGCGPADARGGGVELGEDGPRVSGRKGGASEGSGDSNGGDGDDNDGNGGNGDGDDSGGDGDDSGGDGEGGGGVATAAVATAMAMVAMAVVATAAVSQYKTHEPRRGRKYDEAVRFGWRLRKGLQRFHKKYHVPCHGFGCGFGNIYFHTERKHTPCATRLTAPRARLSCSRTHRVLQSTGVLKIGADPLRA